MTARFLKVLTAMCALICVCHLCWAIVENPCPYSSHAPHWTYEPWGVVATVPPGDYTGQEMPVTAKDRRFAKCDYGGCGGRMWSVYDDHTESKTLATNPGYTYDSFQFTGWQSGQVKNWSLTYDANIPEYN